MEKNTHRTPPHKTIAFMRRHSIGQSRHQQRFPHDSLEDMVIDEAELDQLWAQLEPLEREILLLWAVEEYTPSEIALQLAMPRGTILSRIHCLRQRLREQNHDISTGGRL